MRINFTAGRSESGDGLHFQKRRDAGQRRPSPAPSLRNALLRAADFAVTKTSGLRGFFAGKLAFVAEKTGKTEIYTSDLFFGDVLRWTAENKQIIAPRWSPDGSRIIFTSYRTSFPDIYVLEMANR